MKNLVIDIGNSCIQSAIFAGDELLEDWGLGRFEF
jgi:pantothenate kinase type III